MRNVAPLKILKASAGSGKTFSLTVHYLTLLLTNENSYREILAVTFTNKATAEMKERILEVLRALALGQEDKKIEDYRAMLRQMNPAWSNPDIQQQAYRVYRRILHDYGRFTISTIDGFSQKVIRSFTYELNLDAGYKIEMNMDAVKHDLTIMLNQLLDERPDLLDWIIEYAEKKIANNENWNYRQQLMQLTGLIFSENFQEFDAHLQQADTTKIFHLLQKEINAGTERFLTEFTAAVKTFAAIFKTFGLAADDLKGKSRNKLIVASGKSVALHKLSPSDLQKEFDKYVSLIDNEEPYTDQAKNVRYDIIQQLAPILDQIRLLYANFATYIAFNAVQNNLYYLRLLKEMSDLLSLWRKENAAQLISDSQLLLSKLGIDQNNDPTFIWEKIGNRYAYFLFDEFQDTSRIQWKNYSPLLINALGNASGQLSEHLIVGDVKQSIYRWRNGDWRILLHQAEQQVSSSFHLSAEDKATFIENGSLDTNYRSLPNIIQLNNYLYEAIPKHLQDVLNTNVLANLDEQGQLWWHTSGNAEMLIKAYENSQQSTPVHKLNNHERRGSIAITYFPVQDGRFRNNQVQEASMLAACQQIEEWISTNRYEPRQIGILVRSNKQARYVIQQLMDYKNKTGLTVEVISGDALALASNDAILLLVETLQALVYNSDRHIVHRARVAYLYQLLTNNAPFENDYWLNFKSNAIKDLKDILPHELIAHWDQWQKMPLVHLVEKLIEIYGLTSEGNIHLPYLLAFKDIIATFSSAGERGIGQFLEFWEEYKEKAVLPANGKINAIEVTTIHKSKGLAYDVVMLPFAAWNVDGLVNGDFWINTADTPFSVLGKIPIKYSSSIGKSLFFQQYYEEMLFNYMDALNTLYVATTRAIEHIYISAPAFKEQVDKKTGEITGQDIKNEYISDIILQVLDRSDAPFRMENGAVTVQHPIPREVIEKDTEGKIALDRYPISKELEKAFDKSSKRSINSILIMEKAAQYGILAHEIMSEVSTQNDITRLVDRYIDEGILSEEERPFILQETQQIWNHPQINKWLTGGYKIWNEASIITAGGESIRPDKVFTSPEETIVLDFKFTQGDYVGHKSQVDKYAKTLQNLGYKNVKGFLYYAKSSQLVEVI